MWSFKFVPIPKFICAPKNVARLKKTIPSSYLWCFLKMCAQYIFHNLFDKFISVCICCVWVSIERAMVDCFVFCAYEKCSYLIFELCIYPWQIINQISALFRPLLTKLPLQQMLWAFQCRHRQCVFYIYKLMIYKRNSTWKQLRPFDKKFWHCRFGLAVAITSG